MSNRRMFLLLCVVPCFSGVMPSFLPLAPFANDWRALFYPLFSLATSAVLTLWGIVLTVRSGRGIFGLATFIACIPLLLVTAYHVA